MTQLEKDKFASLVGLAEAVIAHAEACFEDKCSLPHEAKLILAMRTNERRGAHAPKDRRKK